MTKTCDATIISEGTVVAREAEQVLVDRVLHLLEDKLPSVVGNLTLAPTKERYIIRHPQSGLVLDVKGSSRTNGTTVQLWEMNGTDAQVWSLECDGLIVNPPSGKCLNAQGYEQGGPSSVVIFDPQANAPLTKQSWGYTQEGMIVHRATGKALTRTDKGTVGLGVRKGPNDLSQQWSLVPLSLFE